MSDVYVAYIVLARALQYYEVYGKRQMLHSVNLLEMAVGKILEVKSVYTERKDRVMTLIEVRNLQRNKKPLYSPDGTEIGE